MSIMNVFIERDRALVAVDTQVFAGGNRRDGSKSLIIPHARTAMASRGDITYFGWVFNAQLSSGAAGFDELTECMMDSLVQTEAAYRQFLASQGVGTFAGYEIAMVGWSESLGRMMGVRYEKWPDDTRTRITPINPWSLSPNANWETPPKLPEGLEQACRDQVALLRTMPVVASGGRLLLTELTRDAVTTRVAADLEAPQC